MDEPPVDDGGQVERDRELARNARLDQLNRSYTAAVHAMQSGVAMKMNHDPKETEPKHLRVGVNCAMSDGGAIALLLMEKGVITQEEYLEAIGAGMSREVSLYEQELSRLLGTEIVLR
jgi:hypothetical protein